MPRYVFGLISAPIFMLYKTLMFHKGNQDQCTVFLLHAVGNAHVRKLMVYFIYCKYHSDHMNASFDTKVFSLMKDGLFGVLVLQPKLISCETVCTFLNMLRNALPIYYFKNLASFLKNTFLS